MGRSKAVARDDRGRAPVGIKRLRGFRLPFRLSPERCQHRPVIRHFESWGAGVLLLGALASCGRAGGAGKSPVPDTASSSAASSSAASSSAASNSAASAASPRCDTTTGLATLDAAKVSLAQTYASEFKVGVAINGSVYDNRDPAAAALVAAQFNRVTPE